MARRGDISPLTQSSVAICDDHGCWFLVNASPDLPAQVAAFPELQPAKTSPRNTPIAGVLLTNADLDHTLGLLSLREGGKLNVYATRAVREAADISPGVTAVMESFGGVTWQEPPEKELLPLRDGKGAESNVQFRAIGLPGKAPKFAKDVCAEGIHSVAYEFVDGRTGGKLLVAPDVAGLNDAFHAALADADVVLFDGTFWSGDELGRVKERAASASEMGHVTMKDSLDVLKGLSAARKIYIHINNTNPVLRPGSPERDAVESAGITVGFDGLEFEL